MNAGKAADPRDDASELIGLLPRSVERADTTGGEAGDGATVGILANVVFGCDFGEDFIAQEARVAVADGVIERAAHGILEGAIPLLAVGFDEGVGRRTG